jgi:hypothetical protein
MFKPSQGRMMLRLFKFSIIVLLLIGVTLPLAQTNAASIYYFRWDTVTITDCELLYFWMNYTSSWNLPASGAEDRYSWYINGSLDASGITPRSGTGTHAATGFYEFANPPASFPYSGMALFQTYVDGEQVYESRMTYDCPAAGSPGTAQIVNGEVTTRPRTPILPQPGPDMVNLPAGSVVGTFTETTPLFFAPEPGAVTGAVMDIGQSLWVVKLDESGLFYEVVLSGQFLYVPVGTIGPTYDDVWHGTPLPG